MMLMIIMVGTMLLMLATLAYTMGSSAALENGVYYMGITIPAKWRGEDAVKSIRACPRTTAMTERCTTSALLTCRAMAGAVPMYALRRGLPLSSEHRTKRIY